MGILEKCKMIGPELVAYFVSILAAAVALFAWIELHEAREYGKKWMQLTKELKDRVEELEKRKR